MIQIVPFLLAILFAYSGVSKLLYTKEFKSALLSFEIFPNWSISQIAYAVPVVELILATALSIPSIAPYGAIFAVLLLVAFTGIVGISLLQGRRATCGCFTLPKKNEPISLWVVIRNELLIIACGIFIAESLSLGMHPILWGVITFCSILLPVLLWIRSSLHKLSAFPVHPAPSKRSLYLEDTFTRREFLRLGISGLLGILLLPIIRKADASTCWKWQYYDHFDPQCCDWWTWSLHHHYRRCCNTCTGQVGYWQSWSGTTCDTCGCGDRCDQMYGCSQPAAACQAG